MTTKKYYGSQKIEGNPWEQQHWESKKQFEIFGMWLHSGGKLTFTDLALHYSIKPESIQRYSRANLWKERLHRTRGYQNLPEHLTFIDDGTSEIEQAAGLGEDNPAMSRVVSAEEVTAAGYTNVSNLHAKLLKHAERAVNKVDTDALSMSELKALISMVGDLQDQKLAIAKDLLSIEELAQALVEIKRKRGGRK